MPWPWKMILPGLFVFLRKRCWVNRLRSVSGEYFLKRLKEKGLKKTFQEAYYSITEAPFCVAADENLYSYRSAGRLSVP